MKAEPQTISVDGTADERRAILRILRQYEYGGGPMYDIIRARAKSRKGKRA